MTAGLKGIDWLNTRPTRYPEVRSFAQKVHFLGWNSQGYDGICVSNWHIIVKVFFFRRHYQPFYQRYFLVEWKRTFAQASLPCLCFHFEKLLRQIKVEKRKVSLLRSSISRNRNTVHLKTMKKIKSVIFKKRVWSRWCEVYYASLRWTFLDVAMVLEVCLRAFPVVATLSATLFPVWLLISESWVPFWKPFPSLVPSLFKSVTPSLTIGSSVRFSIAFRVWLLHF